MDYSKMKKAQLIEEIEALQERVAELEHAEAERKRAKEALWESEEKYRNLVERANDGICIIQDTIVQYANPRLVEMWGGTVEEVIGTPFTNYVYPDELAKVVDRYKRRMAGEHVTPVYETVLRHKDGTKVHAELNAGITTYRGKPANLVIVRDITERKQAEEALRESEERYRSLFEGAEDHIFVVDQDFRYVMVNPSALKAGGFTLEDIVGKGPREAFPEDAEFYLLQYRQVFETGEPVWFERELRILDGAHWFSVTLSPIKDVRGRVVALTGISRDITERKQAEEALKEYSERLEEMVEERTKELRDAQEQLVRREKLAVIGQMAASVSHELRNPLGTISNAAYYLKMAHSDASETIKEYLGMIIAEIRRADRIISDLLDFSRTRIPDRQKVAVSELVAEVLEKRPPPENVKVTTEIPSELLRVYADPHQLEQVLNNLVINAYQAMPEGGNLTISAQVEEGLVAISVADTGMGIRQENMSKLFEPLFTTKARGLGLGLAVVKTLLEANEGSVEVESEEGKGSTFTLKLPSVGIAIYPDDGEDGGTLKELGRARGATRVTHDPQTGGARPE